MPFFLSGTWVAPFLSFILEVAGNKTRSKLTNQVRIHLISHVSRKTINTAKFHTFSILERRTTKLNSEAIMKSEFSAHFHLEIIKRNSLRVSEEALKYFLGYSKIFYVRRDWSIKFFTVNKSNLFSMRTNSLEPCILKQSKIHFCSNSLSTKFLSFRALLNSFL